MIRRPTDLEIESILREPEDYIENGSFSNETLAKLPPARWRPTIVRRKRIIASFLVIGIALSVPMLQELTPGTIDLNVWTLVGLTLEASTCIGGVGAGTWWLTRGSRG